MRWTGSVRYLILPDDDHLTRADRRIRARNKALLHSRICRRDGWVGLRSVPRWGTEATAGV